MDMKNKENLFNIPNCLCYFRILLIPIFLYVYFGSEFEYHFIVAAFVLVLSGISDFLDGFIARKYDMITELGKLIDPWGGKIATAYFYVVVILLISLHIPNTMLSTVLIITSSALMLLSFVLYGKELKYMVKEKEKLINEQKRN